MRIVCVDDNNGELTGYSSAIAISITLTTKTSEMYLDTTVFVVGAHRVNEMAASALATLDTDVEQYRKGLKVRPTSQGE